MLNWTNFIVLTFPHFVLSKHNTNYQHVNSIIVVLLSSHLEKLLNGRWCICLTEKCTACVWLLGWIKVHYAVDYATKQTKSARYYRPEYKATTEPKLAIFTSYFLVEKIIFLHLVTQHKKRISVQNNLHVILYRTMYSHLVYIPSVSTTRLYLSTPFAVYKCYRSVLSMSE